MVERWHKDFHAVVDNDPGVLEDVLLARPWPRGDTLASSWTRCQPLDEAVDPDAAERRHDGTLDEAPPRELHLQPRG
jgi:hypothetical protein